MASAAIARFVRQGFDKTTQVPFTKRYRVRCSQCEALSINGIPCHEQGCPNKPRLRGSDEDE